MKSGILVYSSDLSLGKTHQISSTCIIFMLLCHLNIDFLRQSGVVAFFSQEKSLSLSWQGKNTVLITKAKVSMEPIIFYAFKECSQTTQRLSKPSSTLKGNSLVTFKKECKLIWEVIVGKNY
jgi:hypothetical protein